MGGTGVAPGAPGDAPGSAYGPGYATGYYSAGAGYYGPGYGAGYYDAVGVPGVGVAASAVGFTSTGAGGVLPGSPLFTGVGLVACGLIYAPVSCVGIFQF